MRHSVKLDSKKNYLQDPIENIALPKNASPNDLENREPYKFKSGATYEG